MASQPRSRRVLRDLVAATLATGAAGLVVSGVVGGTTEGIRAALAPDDRALPTYAADLPGIGARSSADGGAITVRVRPARPMPLGVAAVFELLAPAGPTPSDVRGTRPGRVPPAVVGAAMATAPAAEPVPGSVPGAVEVAPLPTIAAAPVADGLVAASDGPAKRRGPARTSSSSAAAGPKARATGSEPTLTSAAGDRVALSSPAATDAAADAGTDAPTPPSERDRGRAHEAPPAHAPAHGYRNR